MIISIVPMLYSTIALILICIMGVSGQIETVSTYRDALVFRNSGSYVGGAGGGFIVLNTTYSDDTVRHEYGHLMQEQLLGVMYIPVVAINSMLGHLFYKGSYYERWPESWADELSRQ